MGKICKAELEIVMVDVQPPEGDHSPSFCKERLLRKVLDAFQLLDFIETNSGEICS
jgi:hypothetical protein